jgi:hypothetical protein
VIRGIIVSAAVSILIFLAGILIYHRNYSLKVYALDLKGFVAEQQKMLVRGEINKDRMEENFNILERQIKKKGNNVVILTSDVVIKGDKIEMD